MHRSAYGAVTVQHVLRPQRLAELLDVHVSTVYRWVREERLPQVRRIGPNCSGWLSAEIDEWMASRPKASLGEPAQHESEDE